MSVTMMKICPICGEEFETQYRQKRCCSASCAAKGEKERNHSSYYDYVPRNASKRKRYIEI